jgi:hypothetical protein
MWRFCRAPRELVAATTREFGAINERVRGAEARLRDDLARPDLATHLRAVQEAERSKLHFTLIQQARMYPPIRQNPVWALFRRCWECQ